MRLSYRVLFVAGLTVVGTVFFACNQLVDAKLPEQGDFSSSGTSSIGQNSAADKDSINKITTDVVLSDYEYYKNLVVSQDTYEVGLITKWHSGFEDKVVYLLRELRDTIVPQAVSSLVRRFPKTFGYMVNQEIGMGISLSNDEDNPAVATLEARLPNDGAAQYGLRVGYVSFDWESNSLVANSRKELEGYVVHEMMHGLMFEALTCGCFGCDSDMDMSNSDPFPMWFREGTAETTCGGARMLRGRLNKKYPNDVINGTNVLDAETEWQLDVTEDEMKDFINSYPLVESESSTAAAYQTGWLAVMYLGYLANGGTSMNPADIAAGLDTLMSQVHGGSSLSRAIQDHSCGKFSGLGDFETKFTGSNAEAVKFTTELMNSIGSGRGSVLADTYGDFSQTPNDSDLLADQPLESRLFWLYIGSNDVYMNKNYGDKFPLFEGGAAYKDGVPGPGAGTR